MNDNLLTRDELGFEEWSVTPDPETLVPDSIARERERNLFRSNLATDPDAVIVSHTDADGLTSVALLSRLAEDSDHCFQTVGYQNAYRFEHVLDDLQDPPDEFTKRGTALLVADFVPDSADCVDQLSQLIDAGMFVRWFDHHQWGDDLRTAIEDIGVDLTVDTDECAASLIFREVEYDWLHRTHELVTVTKDRDLWINEDPRSPKLNTFARIAGPSEYVNTVLSHGVDFPEEIEDRITERQELDAKLEQAAVDRADSHSMGDGFDVAVTYTAGGNTSNIGNELVENHDPLFDLAVVCTPSSVSFYAHSEASTFDHCHEVAGELGGGGHPTAAGAGVPVYYFRDLAAYWTSCAQGTRAETRILNAVAEVLRGEGT